MQKVSDPQFSHFVAPLPVINNKSLSLIQRELSIDVDNSDRCVDIIHTHHGEITRWQCYDQNISEVIGSVCPGLH